MLTTLQNVYFPLCSPHMHRPHIANDGIVACLLYIFHISYCPTLTALQYNVTFISLLGYVTEFIIKSTLDDNDNSDSSFCINIEYSPCPFHSPTPDKIVGSLHQLPIHQLLWRD